MPEGMGVILRTAGAARTKTEVKRDFEYLLRLWETVRDLTLKSTAPTLVYEEGSLIKRSIRDLYNKDIDEVLVAGDDGYREAKDFMRMLMPSHAKNVKLYQRHPAALHPLRHREPARRDVLADRAAALRRLHRASTRPRRWSRSTSTPAAPRASTTSRTPRSRPICEAADEIARQLRLRDLAGPDRHRLHRHGREAQQPHGRAAAEGGAQERPRAHPGRPHLAFRPDGNVAPAHPLERAGKLDRQVPALRRHRARALGRRRSRCSSCACSRKSLLQGRDPQSRSCAPAPRSRSMCSTTSARICASSRSRFRITITVNADASVGAAQPFLIEKGEQVHRSSRPEGIARSSRRSSPRSRKRTIDEERRRGRGIEDGDRGRGDEAEAETARAAPRASRDGGGEDARRRRRRRRGGGGPRARRRASMARLSREPAVAR